MSTITETNLSSARLSRRGKVRELYDLGDSLLLVASDRISAFDVVLSPGIPDKGKVLTQLSNFWFRKFSDVENHLLETDISRFPEDLQVDASTLAGRSVLVKKCEVVPFECVARVRLSSGAFAGARLPVEFLPRPVDLDRRFPVGLSRSRADAQSGTPRARGVRATRSSPAGVRPATGSWAMYSPAPTSAAG